MPRPCACGAAALFAVGVALAALTPAELARATIPIEFTLTPPSAVAFGSFAVSGDTRGSLVGDWDAESNPSGTRTKPGVFGSFGPTENVPVPTQVRLIAGGDPDTPLAGAFDLWLDPATGTTTLMGLTAAGLAGPGGAVANLPLSARVVFDAFRTRNPTSTFPGGVPVTLPLGTARLDALLLNQLGTGVGTLAPLGPDRFTVSVGFLVGMSGVVEALGNVLPFGPVPIPVALQGEVTLDGVGGAVWTGTAGLSVEQTEAVSVELPPLPLALPTVLPPGAVANVIFALTLEQLALNLAGELTTSATGVVVPEPSGGWPALAVAFMLGRRRRRHGCTACAQPAPPERGMASDGPACRSERRAV